MKIFGYILIMIIMIGQSSYSFAMDFVVSIEGENEVPSFSGGDYTAIVKRTSDKKVIDYPSFKYEWSIKNTDKDEEVEFSIAAPDLKTTGLTLKNGIAATVSGILSCKVSYKRLSRSASKSVKIIEYVINGF